MRTVGPLALALASALAVASGGSAGAPNRFAAFPADGAKASTPTTGTLVVGLRPTANMIWNVYADGRVIWQRWSSSGDATVAPGGASRLDTGFVQQRLTPQGVQLLRSKLLATGLFDQNLWLGTGKHNPWVFYRVRNGDRIMSVQGVSSPDPSWSQRFTKATPAQTRALTSIESFVADPARWLPAGAWANRETSAFVPARYFLSFDRGYPDLSELPSRARQALVVFKRLKRHGCQIVSTSQARALLQAFAQAGISPSSNHAWDIDFDAAAMGVSHPSVLQVFPALPDERTC